MPDLLTLRWLIDFIAEFIDHWGRKPTPEEVQRAANGK